MGEDFDYGLALKTWFFSNKQVSFLWAEGRSFGASFTALRFRTCGLLCFSCLMAGGFVPTWSKICFWDGLGSPSRNMKQSCGGHFPCACCGQTGWRGTKWFLRTCNSR